MHEVKYGARASSGGGRASARETIGRVAAGAVAEKRPGGRGLGQTWLGLMPCLAKVLLRGVEFRGGFCKNII